MRRLFGILFLSLARVLIEKTGPLAKIQIHSLNFLVLRSGMPEAMERDGDDDGDSNTSPEWSPALRFWTSLGITASTLVAIFFYAQCFKVMQRQRGQSMQV